MKRVLISGFEPFGGLESNPTMEIIKRLQDQRFSGAEISTMILPVVYDECSKLLIDKIEQIKPDVILSLGVAVGRAAITPERIGINIQDTVGEGKTGDNSGDKPVDRLISKNGPDGLFSTLPNRDIMDTLLKNNIPAQISNSAGTYICNNTLYSVLHHLREKGSSIKAGFIHVPASPDMVINKPTIPSMDIETQTRAIELTVEVLLGNHIH